MKEQLTPMQELINHIEQVQSIPKEIQKLFLEKERMAIIDSWNDGHGSGMGIDCGDTAEKYYNWKFNTE